MDGSFWVQGTGGSGEGFADVWINEKNPEAELVQPRRRIPAQDMCDGVGKKKTCVLAAGGSVGRGRRTDTITRVDFVRF